MRWCRGLTRAAAAQRMAAERGMPELPWLSRCHCLHAESRHRLCWPHLWPGRYSRGSRFWWLVSLELGVVTGVLIAAGADSHERCRSLGRAWHGHRDRCRFPVIGLDSATEASGRAQNCKATERPDVAVSAWPPLPLQLGPAGRCKQQSHARNRALMSDGSPRAAVAVF